MKETNWNAITAMATVLVAMTGIVAVVFAVVQIREFREEAKIQHLEDRIKEYDSPRFLAIRKALAEKRIDTVQKRLNQLDPDNEPDELDEEMDFCDDLGLLVSRGALSRNDVWSVFSTWLFVLHTDARPVIDEARKDGPAYYGNCTDLVKSMEPIEEKENNGNDDHPSESDIYQFYLSELDAQPGEIKKGKHSH